MWEDQAEALKLIGEPDFILATNETGRDFPGRIDHWVSMHPEKMAAWVKERRAAGRSEAGTLWYPRHKQPPAGFMMSKAPSWGGSSGLLAVTVCLKAILCERTVLAGIPLTTEGAHYFDKRRWVEAHRYRTAWVRYLPELRNRVKSMSGWTRELLGGPEGWQNASADERAA